MTRAYDSVCYRLSRAHVSRRRRHETHTSSKRRLKFAIEFAAIGQQEIEGWLLYFEEMDVNELGARGRVWSLRGRWGGLGGRLMFFL